MAAQEERLTAEIEQAKQNLARDLTELRQEASATGRKAAIAVGAIAAAYVAFKVARILLRRRGQD
jgi:hypothetical protein